jgi:hypothetical protein
MRFPPLRNRVAYEPWRAVRTLRPTRRRGIRMGRGHETIATSSLAGPGSGCQHSSGHRGGLPDPAVGAPKSLIPPPFGEPDV